MKLRTCGPPASALAIYGGLGGSGGSDSKNFGLDKHDANAGQVVSTETTGPGDIGCEKKL